MRDKLRPTADLSGTVDIMRQTRPWVLLLGILGLVGAGLMLVGFLVAAFYAAPGGVNFGITELLVFMLIGLMYTVPAVLMIRYANRITDFLRGPERGPTEHGADRPASILAANRNPRGRHYGDLRDRHSAGGGGRSGRITVTRYRYFRTYSRVAEKTTFPTSSNSPRPRATITWFFCRPSSFRASVDTTWPFSSTI